MKVKILIPRIKLFVVWVAILAAAFTFSGWLASAQQKEVVWTADEQLIADQIHGLRGLADDVRVGTTKDLALKIRRLPASANKLRLAVHLAGLSTEGDFGHDTLQEVATTLAETLRERPVPWVNAKDSEQDGNTWVGRVPADPYIELATLVRYEHVDASLNDNDDGQFRAAMTQLAADDRKREHPDFSLKDLSGKTWTFSDLETLYQRFGSKDFVVLGISDEDAAKVEPFIRERKVSFPVLLDPDRKVNDSFVVEGIPKSFVYDRDGKLVAQSIDMRTQKQFLEMLGKAGLK
jgi:hypothetical protein